MDKLIIDGTNLLHRTFHSSKKINYEYSHIFYILNSIKTYAEMFKTTDIYVCWDETLEEHRKNFRYRLIPEYKAKRNRDNENSIFQYIDIIYEMFGYLGIINIFPQKMEGDDIIAWLCLEYFKENSDYKIVVSTDKDFYQLINYSDKIKIYSPIKKIILEDSNFEKIVGVNKKDFLKYKILLGDSSDNVSGIYKVGPVKAKKITKDWKNYLSQISDDERKILGINTIVMDLKRGYSYYPDESIFYESQLVKPNLDIDTFISKCQEMNLMSILKNRSEWIQLFDKDQNPLNNLMEYFRK